MSVITVKEGGKEGRRREGQNKGRSHEQNCLEGPQRNRLIVSLKREGEGGHDQMREDNGGREGGTERGEREKELR